MYKYPPGNISIHIPPCICEVTPVSEDILYISILKFPLLLFYPSWLFYPTLRIMGSQNWWFGDPNQPCYTESKRSMGECYGVVVVVVGGFKVILFDLRLFFNWLGE